MGASRLWQRIWVQASVLSSQSFAVQTTVENRRGLFGGPGNPIDDCCARQQYNLAADRADTALPADTGNCLPITGRHVRSQPFTAERLRSNNDCPDRHILQFDPSDDRWAGDGCWRQGADLLCIAMDDAVGDRVPAVYVSGGKWCNMRTAIAA